MGHGMGITTVAFDIAPLETYPEQAVAPRPYPFL